MINRLLNQRACQILVLQRPLLACLLQPHQADSGAFVAVAASFQRQLAFLKRKDVELVVVLVITVGIGLAGIDMVGAAHLHERQSIFF